MGKSISVRLTEAELRMLRHAMAIGGVDGSLIGQMDNGRDDPAEVERYDRIVRKLEESLLKVQP